MRPLVFGGGDGAKEELRRQYGDKKMIQVEIEGYDQPIEFEDGTDPEVIQRKVKELVTGVDPRTGEKIGTITKETFGRGLKEAVIEEGPAVVGGIATGLAATAAAPVSLPVLVGAVALGAAGGESMKQIGQHLSGSLGAPKTSIEAAKKIAAKGIEEGAWEAFGGLAMKGVRKILSPFGKRVTEESKEVTAFFKDKLRPVVLLPAEATSSRTLDLIQNVAESSLIGGNRIADFKTDRTKFFDDFADGIIDQFGDRTDPSDLGNLFVSAIEAKRATHTRVSEILYNNVQNAIDMGGGVAAGMDKELLGRAGEITIEPLKPIRGSKLKTARKQFMEEAGGFVRNPQESFKESIQYEKHSGAMDDLAEFAQEVVDENPGISLMDFMGRMNEFGRSPGEVPDFTSWRLFKSIKRDISPQIGVQVPTDSLKSFVAPLRRIADDLGSIEAKNAGDDLIGAIEDLPDTIDFNSARELRSRLISKVDEFSVINKKAPAIGKAKKLISLIDSSIEDSLKAFDRAGRGPGAVGKKFYRGTGRGKDVPDVFETDKIPTGMPGDQPFTWVSESRKGARFYGPDIEEITVKPSARILEEGTAEFDRIAGAGGEVIPVTDMVKKAKDAGYDVLSYDEIEGDIGTIILNESAVIRESATGAYESWRIANRFYREGQKKFNNTMIRRLVKMAEDTGTGAEMIAPAIFRPGQVSKVKKAKAAMDPPTWRKMKGFFMQHLLQKSTDVDGVVRGKRLINQISGKPNSFGMPMMKETFSDAQIAGLQKFAAALELTQGRQAEGAGKVLIQLTQAGAVGSIVTGKLERIAATIIFAPPIVSRMMVNPKTAAWLTKGVSIPPGSEVAAGLLTRLMAASERIRRNMEEENEE